jgi:hypothetical protein
MMTFLKFLGGERFDKSVEQLIGWFERGECTKRNAAQFFTMIHSTFAHSRKLLAEKQLQV